MSSADCAGRSASEEREPGSLSSLLPVKAPRVQAARSSFASGRDILYGLTFPGTGHFPPLYTGSGPGCFDRCAAGSCIPGIYPGSPSHRAVYSRTGSHTPAALLQRKLWSRGWSEKVRGELPGCHAVCRHSPLCLFKTRVNAAPPPAGFSAVRCPSIFSAAERAIVSPMPKLPPLPL